MRFSVLLAVMVYLLISMMMAAVAPSSDTINWQCVNSVEIWCDKGSCSAKAHGEITPLAVSMRSNGEFSVCAYTGCWQGVAEASNFKRRWLWVADDVSFSSQENDPFFQVDISIFLDEGDVGFVRAGGLATPLICKATGKANNDVP